MHLPRLCGWETFSAGILEPPLSLAGSSGTRGWSPWPGDATAEGTGWVRPPRQAVWPPQKAQGWQGHREGQRRKGTPRQCGDSARHHRVPAQDVVAPPPPGSACPIRGHPGSASSSSVVLGGDRQSSSLISLINSQLITRPSEEDVGSAGPRRGLGRARGARGDPLTAWPAAALRGGGAASPSRPPGAGGDIEHPRGHRRSPRASPGQKDGDGTGINQAKQAADVPGRAAARGAGGERG